MAAPSNPYAALPSAVDPAIVRHIRQASQASSSDFGLLMAEAAQESGFRPDAKAATGSAAGLFQFVDSTWLDMVHRYGAKYGQSELAQQISSDPSGKPSVANTATRQRILALRNDPALSASLAGEYAKQNQDEVERALGRPAGPADLYMAHFLGAGGAATFLKALATKGGTPAATLLPDAAAANPAIFFDSATGRAKSVAEIYRTLGSRIEQSASEFASLPQSGGASPLPAMTFAAAMPATAAVPGPSPLDFNGLKLSAPMASMLDMLTLAALRLAAGDTAPGSEQHSV
jgi:hypothetical protein